MSGESHQEIAHASVSVQELSFDAIGVGFCGVQVVLLPASQVSLANRKPANHWHAVVARFSSRQLAISTLQPESPFFGLCLMSPRLMLWLELYDKSKRNMCLAILCNILQL